MAAESAQRGKELPGLSYLCAERNVLEGTPAPDKTGGETRGAEHLYAAEKGTVAKCTADLNLLTMKAQAQPVL